MFFAVTSSHLTCCDERATEFKFARQGADRVRAEKKLARERLPKWFPGVRPLRALGGLTVLPKEFHKGSLIECARKSKLRRDQVTEMAEVISSSVVKNGLLLSGSNDWKAMIVEEGEIVGWNRRSVEAWGKVRVGKRINFNPRDSRVLTKEGEIFIKARVGEYVDILVGMFEKSGVEKVFHSSLLERRAPGPILRHLDIYFAHINYYLYKKLGELNRNESSKNRLGKPIHWRFINVSRQFFKAENPALLFRHFEQSTGVLTHRDLGPMEEIAGWYMDILREEMVV